MSVPELETVSVARTTPEQRAADWWRTTISDAEGDRATRAQLRRCRTPFDALSVPASISLAKRLGRMPEPVAPEWKYRAFDRALSLAIILSHVRVNSPAPLMRTLGWTTFPYDVAETDVGDAKPMLSESRFRRFLTTEGEADLVAAFSRLVRLAGGETHVEQLARAVLHFEEDRTKRDLGLAYFRANDRGLR